MAMTEEVPLEEQVMLLPLEQPAMRMDWIDISWLDMPDIGPRPSSALKASVAAFGVWEPVLVVPAGGGRYRLREGRRRVLAAQEARLDKVPAMIVVDLENVGEAVVALSAHTLRGDNAPWELRQIEALFRSGASESTIARAVGMPVGTLRRRMKLLGLLPELRAAFEANRFGLGVAEALAKIPEEAQRRLLGLLGEKGKLTLGDVREARQVDRQGGADDLPLDDLELDDDLSDFGSNGQLPVWRVPNEVVELLVDIMTLASKFPRPLGESGARIAAMAARAQAALRTLGRPDSTA
jgi:ParB-like chromosome segregation protein Spo0J